MAFAAEAGVGVDQRHGGAEAFEAVGVDAGGDVALQDADAEAVAQRHQRVVEERGLARPRRRHEVDGPHAGARRSRRFSSATRSFSDRMVLQHHPGGAGRRIAAVVADVAAVMVVGVVVVLRAVVLVQGTRRGGVEATHQARRP